MSQTPWDPFSFPSSCAYAGGENQRLSTRLDFFYFSGEIWPWVSQCSFLIGSHHHTIQDCEVDCNCNEGEAARTFDKEPLPLHESIFSYRDNITKLKNIESPI
jgi:hypothetical protein